MRLHHAAIRQILKETDLFGELSEESRDAIAQTCISRHFEKREILFREGSNGSTIYILTKGRVQLVKAAQDGREVAIRTIKPGQTFAEVILFERKQYPVTATALTRVEVLGFLRDDIVRLLDDRSIRHDFITMLMKRQRYLLEQLRALSTDDVETRLIRFLQEQHKPGTVIHLDLSKKDIAAAIGTTPETLSRLILRLRTRGLLDWKGKTLHVKPDFWLNNPKQKP